MALSTEPTTESNTEPTTEAGTRINIKLRIVGLYFNKTVSIEKKDGLTVRDVLDEYISLNPDLSKPGGLEYSRFPRNIPTGTDFLKTFTYHFEGDYDFNGNNVITEPSDGPSLGNIKRKEGIYTLSEDFEDSFADKTVGLIWQYYVVAPETKDGRGVVKSRTPESRKFNAFGDNTNPGYTLEDGDTIIWRLVAIVRAPNFLGGLTEAAPYSTPA
ncbi:MAG: hypothetical protein H7Z72_01415 [Bacteroidetes bacterium]|nr:hypothetical protein [Fibrella sp.]